MTFTVYNTYDVASVEEFESLLKACGWNIIHKYKLGLSIVTWKYGANISISPSVKGLIYRPSDGKILAPGVAIPLEKEPEGIAPVYFSRALDGIMVRFWFSPALNKFTWSTNGQIVPGTWRGADINKIITQQQRELKLELLNKDLCYFAVLEHPDIPNIYQVTHATMTLVRILDLAGTEYPLHICPTQAFTLINHVSTEPIPLENGPAEAGPTTRDTFGIIKHYADGSIFRTLSRNAKDAEIFRVNYREVWQHWINLVLDTEPDSWDCGPIFWYKIYFPWNAAQIDGLSACFLDTVPPPEQKEILESADELKKIVVYKYLNTINSIKSWSPRNINMNITVPHLGTFQDIDEAQNSIAYHLNNQTLLFRSTIQD